MLQSNLIMPVYIYLDLEKKRKGQSIDDSNSVLSSSILAAAETREK